MLWVFSCDDGDLSNQLRLPGEKFVGCFIRQIHQFLGPVAQQHPLVRQDDMIAAAVKELLRADMALLVTITSAYLPS